MTEILISENPTSFRQISECPCGTCVRKFLPIYDHICVECKDSNDWKNYRKNLDGRFEKKEKPKRRLFSFDDNY